MYGLCESQNEKKSGSLILGKPDPLLVCFFFFTADNKIICFHMEFSMQNACYFKAYKWDTWLFFSYISIKYY